MKNRILNLIYSGNKFCWILIKYLLYLIVILTIKDNKGFNFDTIYNIFLTSTIGIVIYGAILILIKELINNYIRFSEYVYSYINHNSTTTFDITRLSRKLYIASIINLVFSLIILGIIPLIYTIYSIFTLNKLQRIETNITISTSNNTTKQSNISNTQEIKIAFKRILVLIGLIALLSLIVLIIKRNNKFESKEVNSKTSQDFKYKCTPHYGKNYNGEKNIASSSTIAYTDSAIVTLAVVSNYSNFYISVTCNFKTYVDTLTSYQLKIGETSVNLNVESFRIAYINGFRTLVAFCTFPEISDETQKTNIASISMKTSKEFYHFTIMNPISISNLLNCVKDEVEKNNPLISEKSSYVESEINSESVNNSESDFYIVRHSAYRSEASARELVKKLNSQYINSNYLWIPDYRTLGSNQYYLVYYGPFKSETECSNFIEAQGDNLTQANYGELVSNGINRVIIRKGRNVKRLSISE